MKIMIQFFKAVLRMPKPWVAWLALLMIVNMVVPIFFIETLEAQVVLATLLASAVLMMFIFAQKGFVRLLGLGHVLWIPLLLWLSGRIDFTDASTGLDRWLVAITVLNGLSLVIDVVDVIRYAKGERAPTVTVD
jgi:hypothetical protein